MPTFTGNLDYLLVAILSIAISPKILFAYNYINFIDFKTFVHGFIVGPTENPLLLDRFNNTLFTKKLLPVRYFPTMDITPNGISEGRLSRNYAASLLNSNFPE